jgi:hypothetical protein
VSTRPRPDRDDVLAALTGATAIASLLVTCAIALRTPQAAALVLVQPLANQTSALLAGLVSAHLMLLQVWFLARLPWLERAWGRPLLTRLHRVAGYWSFWLMLLHCSCCSASRARRATRAVRCGGCS